MSDSDQKVTEFKPRSLEDNRVEIKPFRPKTLQSGQVRDYSQIKTEFGSLANTDPAAPAHFSMHPDSKKLLGVEQAEKTHLEDVVRSEVESRVEAIRDDAYSKGFKKGLVDGMEKSRQDFTAEMGPVFENFQVWMKQCEEIKHDLYVANEKLMIQLIYQIGKQVILRDLKVDGDYLKRLCSEVIDKVGAKDYVRIQINSEDFTNVEKLREFLKGEFPDLKNIQFEVTEDLPMGGCKVETDLSRINAGIGMQLDSIEKTLGEL